MSSGGKTETEYTISPEQRKALKTVMDWAKPALDARGPGVQYGGQMVADTPDLFSQAYGQYSQNQFGALSDTAISELISGKPAYAFDAGETSNRWKSTYAEPVMNAWRQNVLPSLKESMNMPGSLYSRGTSDYIAKQAGDFYGGQVAPSLFSALQTGEQLGAQSLEAAAGRRAGAMSLPFAQFMQGAGVAGSLQQQEQAKLSAAYQEFLRTDPMQYAQLLGGIGSQQTQDVVGFQGTDYMSGLIGAGAYMAGSGSLGGILGGIGGALGGI